ncbi:hypothetical protein [Kordiimonas marina]|uniref:hypothetical protein n=1 Tax=Kordiimonas marina TaxID=2872312 RepID=UPI001FF5DF31|nr:hypothetical protein [Kordiimonas marina]MCJ9429157.1 hypothetical protein [Kordiimonas marina]
MAKRSWRIVAFIYGYLGGAMLVLFPVSAFIDLVLFGPNGVPFGARLATFFDVMSQGRAYVALIPVGILLFLVALAIVIDDWRGLAKACRRAGISMAEFGALDEAAQEAVIAKHVRARQAVQKSPIWLSLTRVKEDGGENHDPKRRYQRFDPALGYPAAAHFFYECAACGDVLPSKPEGDLRCRCGNIAIDTGAGRVSVKDEAKFKCFAEV